MIGPRDNVFPGSAQSAVAIDGPGYRLVTRSLFLAQRWSRDFVVVYMTVRRTGAGVLAVCIARCCIYPL